MRKGSQPPRLAVGLARVSTAEQGNSGLDLEAQQASIRAFVSAQGWTMVAEFSEIASGKDNRRAGFQAALARCRQLDGVLVAARLDRTTLRAGTLSPPLEDGVSISAADTAGADDAMLRIDAAMAQKERDLISERTTAAPAAAQAAQARRQAAARAAHRLVLEIERLRIEGTGGRAARGRASSARCVATPGGTGTWTQATVSRVMQRAASSLVAD
jgi:DNA invertase Pin-like site-specific DNA recombinase